MSSKDPTNQKTRVGSEKKNGTGEVVEMWTPKAGLGQVGSNAPSSPLVSEVKDPAPKRLASIVEAWQVLCVTAVALLAAGFSAASLYFGLSTDEEVDAKIAEVHKLISDHDEWSRDQVRARDDRFEKIFTELKDLRDKDIAALREDMAEIKGRLEGTKGRNR